MFIVLVFAAALVTRAAAFQARTVKDKVYTKEQAARGEASFTKNCAKCHLLADRKPSDPVGASDGPSLGGPQFLTKWDGKSVFEMTTGIRLSMPPDGSITVSEDDAADLAAYLIKVNGFPEGTQPLKADASARTLMWVKPGATSADAGARVDARAADAAAVYLAVLQAMFGGRFALHQPLDGELLIVDHTNNEYVAKLLAERPETVTRKWPSLASALEDFQRGKGDSRGVATPAAWPPGCRLVPKSEIDEIFKDGPLGWPEFAKRFPRATGFVQLSNVGFTTAGDEAFVYVIHSCGGLCGTGHYVWMKKLTPGGWQVADQVMAWIS